MTDASTPQRAASALSLTRLCRFVSSMVADRKGVAAVEFALLIPFIVLIYLGSVEISQAITAQRKLTLAVETLGDLASRHETLDDDLISEIFLAAETIMFPVTIDTLELTVTGLERDPDDSIRVAWSRSQGGTAYPEDTAYDFGEGQTPSDDFIVMAEASLTYTSTIAKVIDLPMTFNRSLRFVPRESARTSFRD